MIKKNILLLLIVIGSLQANPLLEKPKSITSEQINQLAQSWNTQFTWQWRKIGACSFSYEKGNAGFALKLLEIPFYAKGYRLLPTMQEIKQLFNHPSYYFATPLEYKKASPTHINKEELFSLMTNKKCIFYTGAGISAMSNVATMKGLEASLNMDKGIRAFLKEAWRNPEQIRAAFAVFCNSAINGEPTSAHYALKKMAQEKSVAIITENVDLLQQRTGIEPIFAYSELLASIPKNDWQQIDAIICIGLSHDDRGLLAWYKQHNPDGILVAIDLKVPNYLSDNDYVCLGNLQEILMNEEIAIYNLIEPHYPSYVSQNYYGLCLRAVRDLKKGTIVATADFEQTDKAYIADHSDQEHKYVAVMQITQDGKPIYGRIRGKWAFCNHSCDPNCDISDTWEIITNRDVAKGQELTTSYDAFVDNLPWPESWNFKCLCEAPNCKKVIKEYRMDILYPTCNK